MFKDNDIFNLIMKPNQKNSFLDLIVITTSLKFLLQSENKYLRTKSLNFNWGIIWNFLNPLIIVIGFAILFSSGIRGQGRDLEYFLFLILLWFGFSQTVTRCINFNPGIFFQNKKKLNNWILILSESFSQILPLFIRLLICMYTMTFIGFDLEFYHLFYCFILLSLFAVSYACIIRTLMMRNSLFSDAHGFFLTGLFFLSSIIIPVPLLPENIRNILLYNPIVHLFEWVKFPTTGIYYDFIDLNYFLNFLLLMMIVTPIFIMIHSRQVHLNKSK